MDTLILNATTKSIKGVCGSITTSNPVFTAHYADNSTVFEEGANDGAFNGTTLVDIVVAPAASTRRIVKNITLHNADTVNQTISLMYDNNGTSRLIFRKIFVPGEYWDFGIGNVDYATSQQLSEITSSVNTHLADKASLTELAHIKIGPAGSVDVNGVYTPGGYKLVNATHDISVTGAQAITGVGFRPRFVRITAVVGDTFRSSIGSYDGTSGFVFYHRAVADTWATDASVVIDLYTSSGVEAYASIGFDTDGITITWSKAGEPTGTANLCIECFK